MRPLAPWVAWFALAVAVAGLLVVGWLLCRGRPAADRPPTSEVAASTPAPPAPSPPVKPEPAPAREPERRNDEAPGEAPQPPAEEAPQPADPEPDPTPVPEPPSPPAPPEPPPPEADPAPPPVQEPVPPKPAGLRLQGQAWRYFRGWTAPGTTLVTVDAPLSRGTFHLGRLSLCQGGQPLASCVGIVPPGSFFGRLSGTWSEYRTNTPLPIEDLRPIRRGAELVVLGDIDVTDYLFPRPIRNALILGHDLVLHAEGGNTWLLSAPEVTYVLLPNGCHATLARREENDPSGIQFSAQKRARLLFVVPGRPAFPFQLVDEAGVVHEVRQAGAGAR